MDCYPKNSVARDAKRRVPAGIKRKVLGLKFQSGSGVRCVKTKKKKKRKIRDVFA